MRRRIAIIWRCYILPALLSYGDRLSRSIQDLFPDKLLIYDIFPEGHCFREEAYANVVGNSVKAIRVSYGILRISGIRRVEVPL